MRILIKGGVWKNTEDEILKAAVMKYGLNQWARISSLLVRKSAKQCKARWYEWLDPAIKKTEWTREEDEKLLHLAKLMPTQWRTIAPIVGRTATQCLERYERLLDMASGREEGLMDGKDDPRRLRPGEIDPHPETKPARPDAVDMDEEEKEMLSEARARLANTKGKKAKRKAREKQLEEARRLASLQKQRELKAAGIDVREKAKKGMGIDYATEVPFERRPAPGFYDVSEENEITRTMRDAFRPVTKDELEGRKRKDIEKELVKQDVAKRKIAERKDAPGVMGQGLEGETSSVSRRGKMMLPAPQVTDAELEILARDGAAVEAYEGTGSQATRTLMGDYRTPMTFATPMRTPGGQQTGSGPGMNKVMLEAQALARLQQGQTPLLGGENPDISGADFSGITPQRKIEATPNPLAAAAAAAAAGKVGATPGVGSIEPTPNRRDALHLNTAPSSGVGTSTIKSALTNLPAPKGEYQLAGPDVDMADEDEEAVPMEEDAAEREARIAAEEAKRLEYEIKMRSSVIQRNLPRPLSLAHLDVELAETTKDPQSVAAQLIMKEYASLLHEDAKRFPPNRPIDSSICTAKPEFSLEELSEASRMILEEVPALKQSLGHQDATFQDYADVWTSMDRDMMFSPTSGTYVPKSSMSQEDIIASLKHEFKAIREEMATCANKAQNIEQKIGLVLGGLQKRSRSLTEDINSKIGKMNIAKIEKACYQRLLEREKHAVPARLEYHRSLVQAQEEKERNLQEKYKMIKERMST